MSVIIGIDLGGTKILTVAATEDGRILARKRVATPKGRDAVVAAMRETVQTALADAGAQAPAALGIGAPGPMDPAAGILLDPPNLPGCENLPLADLFRASYPKADIHVENDANAAALGERRFGAGRGVDDLCYVTISTGVGGGIVAAGRLVRGAAGTGGEVGHTVLDPDGPQCHCGLHGCWEVLASGTAIAREAAAALARGEGAGIAAAAGDGPPDARAVDIAAGRGDQAALRIVASAVRYNGIGFCNLIQVLSPARIIVGGGVSHAWDRYIAPAAQWAKAHAFERPGRMCAIVPADLGDDVGALGAVAVALGDGDR
ncbi:MAG TPA: ROK family protein [Bacillota bacterium]|nr:ROK family protein [Bacillota bacterium]